MGWTCPRCGAENADSGEEARDPGQTDSWGHPRWANRLLGVECACGLTRAGWLTGPAEYAYPVPGGWVDVRRGQSTVCLAIPNPPDEYTPPDAHRVVAVFDVERFDIQTAASP